jgi:aerobic carbon-monoxide dehydrogenase medium subunit
VKPASFEYAEPRSVPEALETLTRYGDDSKILAGGQSLVPLLNMRLAQPSVLIDINRLSELDTIAEREHDGILGVAIGALTRQTAVERNAELLKRFPLLGQAIGWIGHSQIRNRGTIGGSIAHADSAAELPIVFRALDGVATVRSERGTRVIPASEFFLYAMTPALAPDELLVDIWLPYPSPHTGFAFREIARRHGDFALVAVAVAVTIDVGDGHRSVLRQGTHHIVSTSISLGGAAPIPLRATAAEESLTGQSPSLDAWSTAAGLVEKAAEPTGDIHADAQYRRDMAGRLSYEALQRAYEQVSRLPRAGRSHLG